MRVQALVERHGSSQPLENGAAAVLIRGLSALVEQARVAVRLDWLEISLQVEGITSVFEDLRLRESAEGQAA
jgi:hypothetical protein